MTHADKHAAFVKLHDRSALLILANAWDAASARVIEHAGAKAVATSSVAVATSYGYADGNHLPKADALGAVRRIARSVEVPVSADLEEGFGITPDEVADTAVQAAKAGAVGMNFEDAVKDAAAYAAKLKAMRAALKAAGLPFFINARVDTLLRNAPGGLDDAIARAKLYAEAGADGIFVPGAVKPDDIRALAAATPLPLNVLLFPGLPPVKDLLALGVARFSTGGGPHRAALGATDKVARAILAGETTAIAEMGLAADVFRTVVNR
jgi:2-methylisocitrate lyase-like PEP mutase family enzyme